MTVLTLLDYVQTILSSMGSDQVNSISDTPESVQVAECVRTTYMNMLGRYEMPEHIQLVQLTAAIDESTPTLMYRPEGTTRLEEIWYLNTNPADGSSFFDQYGAYSQHDVNVDITGGTPWSTTSTSSVAIVSSGTVTYTVASGLQINVGDAATAYNGIPGFGGNSMSGVVASYSSTTLVITVTSNIGAGTFDVWTIINSPVPPTGPGYQEVNIIPSVEFIRMTQSFNPTENDVGQMLISVTNDDTSQVQQFKFNYKNDKQPQYCCVISNKYIVFDSYDNTQDTTLQQNKTMCFGWVVPSWTMSDTFVPNLQDQQVPLLLNDAKSLAWSEIKNQLHQKAEEEVGRQLVSLQKWKALADHHTYFNQLPNFGRQGAGWYP